MRDWNVPFHQGPRVRPPVLNLKFSYEGLKHRFYAGALGANNGPKLEVFLWGIETSTATQVDVPWNAGPKLEVFLWGIETLQLRPRLL